MECECPVWNREMKEGGGTYAYIPTRQMKTGRGANKAVGDNADTDNDEGG